MTSSPPEELSSFFISAAAWLSPGQQPATQGEGTSACLRIRDRLLHFPSVSPSDCAATRRCPPHPLPHPHPPFPNPCYSRENTAIWYVPLFVPGWSDWQRGLRRKALYAWSAAESAAQAAYGTKPLTASRRQKKKKSTKKINEFVL